MLHSRYNIYTLIHKALRAEMFDVLVGLGQLDDSDQRVVERELERVSKLLDLCQAHLEHENGFIHPAITAQRPHLHLITVEDHLEHEASIRRLRLELAAVLDATGEARAVPLLQLYRNLAVFVAENLHHMQVEETLNARILWEQFSDEQILEIEGRLVASMTPAEQMDSLLLMLTHISHSERIGLLQALVGQMPATVLEQLLGALRPTLGEPYVERLARLVTSGSHQAA